MSKVQLKNNKNNITQNKNRSNGGLATQKIANTPIMQQKAKEQSDMFGEGFAV